MNGLGGVVRDPRSLPALLVLVTILLFGGCGGGAQKASQPPPPPAPKEGAKGGATTAKGGANKAKGGAPGENTAGGAVVESKTGAEALKDTPFELNQRLAVPPDFRAAYQRRALIVIEFYKPDPDSRRGDIDYPQGISTDDQVHTDLERLRQGGDERCSGEDYTQIEFFAYDIGRPGDAETSEELDRGEYGTLAAQLDVGYTPFVAMLAPRGEGYVIENLFQGYVERCVLDQALRDLAASDLGGNSSDVEVLLDRVELTESGGGIEYITVINEDDAEADLSGFTLQVQDPETGDTDAGGRVEIDPNVRLAPGQEASIGRQSQITDADGREVIGTFSNAESLALRAGDQVALLDTGGAVVDTITI